MGKEVKMNILFFKYNNRISITFLRIEEVIITNVSFEPAN